MKLRTVRPGLHFIALQKEGESTFCLTIYFMIDKFTQFIAQTSIALQKEGESIGLAQILFHSLFYNSQIITHSSIVLQRESKSIRLAHICHR